MVYVDRAGHKWRSKSVYYAFLAADNRKPKKLREKYRRLSKK